MALMAQIFTYQCLQGESLTEAHANLAAMQEYRQQLAHAPADRPVIGKQQFDRGGFNVWRLPPENADGHQLHLITVPLFHGADRAQQARGLAAWIRAADPGLLSTEKCVGFLLSRPVRGRPHRPGQTRLAALAIQHDQVGQ